MVRKSLITQGYSLAEEIANSVSHGIGLVFGIVGLVLLLVQAVDSNAGATAITSYSLYGGSMILLFLASTLYHAIPHQRAKLWLKKFDHCAIYLLIAGTYTPFLLVGLNSPLSRGLMIVIWSLALLGILFKLTIAHRFKILSGTVLSWAAACATSSPFICTSGRFKFREISRLALRLAGLQVHRRLRAGSPDMARQRRLRDILRW